MKRLLVHFEFGIFIQFIKILKQYKKSHALLICNYEQVSKGGMNYVPAK